MPAAKRNRIPPLIGTVHGGGQQEGPVGPVGP